LFRSQSGSRSAHHFERLILVLARVRRTAPQTQTQICHIEQALGAFNSVTYTSSCDLLESDMARPSRHQTQHLPDFLDPPSDPDQLSEEEVAAELLGEEEEAVDDDEEGIVGKQTEHPAFT
jgi:hypothetical protein